ncbi:hypothetical protein, partial [Escherichia coli]|uniref:hypothetical protein n=1 Tax=Escherichia coli TaxID=562 RepID=UPI0009413895
KSSQLQGRSHEILFIQQSPLIHENTGFLDSDAQRCAFVCHYSEINQKIRRGRSLVQQPDQKPLTQQGLTV